MEMISQWRRQAESMPLCPHFVGQWFESEKSHSQRDIICQCFRKRCWSKLKRGELQATEGRIKWCCWTAYNVQDSPHPRISPAQNITRVENEKSTVENQGCVPIFACQNREGKIVKRIKTDLGAFLQQWTRKKCCSNISHSNTYNTGTLNAFISFRVKSLPFLVLHTLKHAAWKAEKNLEPGNRLHLTPHTSFIIIISFSNTLPKQNFFKNIEQDCFIGRKKQ